MNRLHPVPRNMLIVATAAMLVAGCAAIRPNANLVAFSTTMTGANEVPPVATNATGEVDAVLNKDTLLLRWKLFCQSLSSAPTMAHFHGPAAVGQNARVVLPFKRPITCPMEGRATLTPEQARELIAGKWYANVHTTDHPGGEIRGQMIVRP
ncbi:MAG: CHRD domain containing protein [Burkholderiaceae bacterium]|nr:MAG: CHRD domain containing protein [Burkholderiaceae bacterium]